MKEKQKNISVSLAGRSYPLKIKESEEAMIREVVKGLNEQINTFQVAYATKDKQDCMGMVLLTVAMELRQLKASNSYQEAHNQLDEINAFLGQLNT